MSGWFQPLFDWSERLIDPFSYHAIEQPPSTLIGFYRYYVMQVWPIFLALLLIGLVGAIIEVALFAFLGNIVDLVRDAADPAAFFAAHGTTLLWMAAVTMFLRPLVMLGHDLLVLQAITPSFTNLVRWQAHRYVLRQSLSFFQNDFAGRIATKIIQTGPALRETMVQVADAVWFMVIYTTSAAILFAQANWLLVLPLLVWLAFYIQTLLHFVPRIKERARIMAEAKSMLTGRVVDSYTNMMTVKLFAHADREDTYAQDALVEHTAKAHEQSRLITKMKTALFTINGVWIVVATGLALHLWSRGAITVGAIALVVGLVLRINNMSGWIMWTITSVFEQIGTVQDGIATISRPQRVLDVPGAPALVVRRGDIRFERIRFHYGLGKGVIDDLSLNIRPGEKVGLVGRSGAGKSTLVNLLLRFHDLESGRILIDGQDISKVAQESLRAQIGMVTQDTSLLHRSVLANIVYGRPGVAPEEAELAAAKAHAQDFIPRLMDLSGRTGYAAHVGERGVKLSGGQRQRIAIARVLLKNAPILILDEATSALDSEVEAAIQEQFNNLMANKTVIAIAHRLSTIAAMDRLVLMDQGQIIEQGSHATLLASGGLYAELWSRQSGGFLAKDLGGETTAGQGSPEPAPPAGQLAAATLADEAGAHRAVALVDGGREG